MFIKCLTTIVKRNFIYIILTLANYFRCFFFTVKTHKNKAFYPAEQTMMSFLLKCLFANVIISSAVHDLNASNKVE